MNAEGIPDGLSQGFSLSGPCDIYRKWFAWLWDSPKILRGWCVFVAMGVRRTIIPIMGLWIAGPAEGHRAMQMLEFLPRWQMNLKFVVILKKKELLIPDDTWFLPGKHNTTTDRVEFYDLEELPDSHKKDLLGLNKDLEKSWSEAGS